MDAKVTWRDGLSFTGSASTGFEVPLGADPAVGGANDGFRPLELMAISLAGCTAMDVISILRKKQQDITGFEVLVHADQAPEYPKVFTNITVLYRVTGNTLDEASFRRAIELTVTKYCPAQAMLGKVAAMTFEYEIFDEGGGLVNKGIFKPGTD